MDLAHVRDLEHLRSIATVQQAQIRHLIEALRQKCKELEAFKGEGELQRTLALLEEHARTYPNGSMALERDALHTIASCDLERTPDALARARALLGSGRSVSYAARIRAVLQDLLDGKAPSLPAEQRAFG